MCGLIVAIDKFNKVSSKQMHSMASRISHRGPDGSGIIFVGITKMVHLRLAIIDSDQSANQPMISDCGNISIVFNGEIYNHREIRKDLEELGICFKTNHSDTEVLLRGYIYWGLEKLIKRLTGIFAFVINNEVTGKLHAVRDHFGIKPLYKLIFEDVIYFASELKAFKEIPTFKFKLDQERLTEHLYFRHVKAPNTLVKEVKKLRPAEIQTIDLKNLTTEFSIYWNPFLKCEYLPDACDRLKSSIIYNLESDAGVTLSLSGGFDSRSIASLICEIKPEIEFSAYTVAYPKNEEFDEAIDAINHAKKLNLPHHIENITEKEFRDNLIEVVYYLEEPISAPVSLPVFLMARTMSDDGVKVALAGEGADEIYCGYQSWKSFLLLVRIQRRLPVLSNLVFRIFRSILSTQIFKNYRFNYLRDILWRGIHSKNLFWGGSWDFSAYDISTLLKIDENDVLNSLNNEKIYPEWLEFKKHNDQNDQLGWMTFCDLRSRLPELLLNRLDKQFMAHSIESRVPFLDHLSVQKYFSRPSKIRESEISKGKDFLRALIANILRDDELLKTRKKGFQAPVARWNRSSFGNKAREIVINFTNCTGLFDVKSVEAIFERGSRHYFSLLFFVIWYCNYIDDVLPEYNLKFFPELANKEM
jgi:asparagine synthase (glutamine-hydrolysing)